MSEPGRCWLLLTDSPPETSGYQMGLNLGWNRWWWRCYKEGNSLIQKTWWESRRFESSCRHWIFSLEISVKYQPGWFDSNCRIILCMRHYNLQSPAVQARNVPVIKINCPRVVRKREKRAFGDNFCFAEMPLLQKSQHVLLLWPGLSFVWFLFDDWKIRFFCKKLLGIR